MFSLVILVRGARGKLSRLVYLAPPPQDLGQTVSSVLDHNLGIFSCKRCKHYFSQTEMFTFNIQFGYPCPRSGWQAVQAGLFCPSPPPPPPQTRQAFGSGSVISQFLLHHNLGIFSCMRYKHYLGETEMFASNAQFGYPCSRGGGKCPGWFISRLASIVRPGKPRWENPGFPGLGNTPRNGSTGQYWVIRYFPPVFIMKYFKAARIVVLLLKLNIL